MAIPPWDRYAVIVGMTDILARSESPSVGIAAKSNFGGTNGRME
jgi:hypothetical protein